MDMVTHVPNMVKSVHSFLPLGAQFKPDSLYPVSHAHFDVSSHTLLATDEQLAESVQLDPSAVKNKCFSS